MTNTDAMALLRRAMQKEGHIPGFISVKAARLRNDCVMKGRPLEATDREVRVSKSNLNGAVQQSQSMTKDETLDESASPFQDFEAHARKCIATSSLGYRDMAESDDNLTHSRIDSDPNCSLQNNDTAVILLGRAGTNNDIERCDANAVQTSPEVMLVQNSGAEESKPVS